MVYSITIRSVSREHGHLVLSSSDLTNTLEETKNIPFLFFVFILMNIFRFQKKTTWSTLAGQKIESHLLHWFKLKSVTLLLLYYFLFFIFFDVCRPDNLMDYVFLSVPGTQLFSPRVCVCVCPVRSFFRYV